MVPSGAIPSNKVSVEELEASRVFRTVLSVRRSYAISLVHDNEYQVARALPYWRMRRASTNSRKRF